MPKIKTRLGQTYYERFGKKTADDIPLVCLHGGPGGTHYYFTPLKSLSKRREIIFYDQIGSGRSSPIAKKHQTVKTLVDNLDNLLKKLKIERCHLLGVSWGGTLAIEYYLKKQRIGIESLILQSPFVSNLVWERDARRLLATLSKQDQKIIKTCLEIGATDSKVYLEAEKEYYKRYVLRQNPHPKGKAYAKKYPNPHGRELYQHMWGPSEFKADGLLRSYEREKALSRIKVPTLFICGQFDEATPESMRRFSRRVQSSRVEVIKGGSHALAMEKPAVLMKVIERFLRE